MKTSILFVVLLATTAVYNQNRGDITDDGRFVYKNSIQLDLLGSTGIYSINYERLLINRPILKMSIQAGASYFNSFALPVSINQFVSFGKNHLEIGIGHSTTFWDHPDGFLNQVVPKFGYRYQKVDGRLIFKMLFTPLIVYNPYSQFIPWGVVTFGYTF